MLACSTARDWRTQVHATFFFEKITVKNQTTPGRRHPNTTELAGSRSKFCSAASSIFTRKQIIGCACSPKEHGPGPMYPHPPTTADRGQLSRSIAAVPWVHNGAAYPCDRRPSEGPSARYGDRPNPS